MKIWLAPERKELGSEKRRNEMELVRQLKSVHCKM